MENGSIENSLLENSLFENGLSVCLIVKNEEKKITNCLISIIKLSNEINLEVIIVDTGSVDRTKSMIADLNINNLIHLYDFKWNDNFSDARNYAISKAKYNMILSIDADEVIENENKLIEIVKSPNKDIAAWLINIESFAEKIIV